MTDIQANILMHRQYPTYPKQHKHFCDEARVVTVLSLFLQETYTSITHKLKKKKKIYPYEKPLSTEKVLFTCNCTGERGVLDVDVVHDDDVQGDQKDTSNITDTKTFFQTPYFFDWFYEICYSFGNPNSLHFKTETTVIFSKDILRKNA